MLDEGEAYEGQWSAPEPNVMGQSRRFLYRTLQAECHRRAPEVMVQHVTRVMRNGLDPFEAAETLVDYWNAERDLYWQQHKDATWRDFLRHMRDEDAKLIKENEQWSRERYKERWGMA